jgi:hypothetical protein
MLCLQVERKRAELLFCGTSLSSAANGQHQASIAVLASALTKGVVCLSVVVVIGRLYRYREGGTEKVEVQTSLSSATGALGPSHSKEYSDALCVQSMPINRRLEVHPLRRLRFASQDHPRPSSL